MRSDVMKSLVRKNESMRTLKNQYEVWEDRPKLEATEEVDSSGIWNQSVDDLRDQNLILHCCMSIDNSKVDFVFHENTDEDGDGRLDEV